jgi:hypothetical protein
VNAGPITKQLQLETLYNFCCGKVLGEEAHPADKDVLATIAILRYDCFWKIRASAMKVIVNTEHIPISSLPKCMMDDSDEDSSSDTDEEDDENKWDNIVFGAYNEESKNWSWQRYINYKKKIVALDIK